MINPIFFLLVFILIIWTIYMYLENDQYIENELKRVSMIENKIQKIKENEMKHRQNTTACSVSNLTTPRDCFIHSNYKCKWCELSNRCNEI